MLTKCRQHLQAFLLRHGRIYSGKSTRTLAWRRWLTTLRFDYPAQQIVLQDYIHAVEDAEARVAGLTRQIEELTPSWSLAPLVRAFQAMRGVAFIVAVTIVAEDGDFTRFANPHQLMAYLGLVPSEHSSGSSGAPRRPDQDRQRPGQASADRSGLDLPHAGPNQPNPARPDRGPAQSCPRHRMEGAGQALRPVPATARKRQGQGRGGRRHSPRARRLPLGHRPAGARSRPRSKRPARCPRLEAGHAWGALVLVLSRLRPTLAL
jgi:hypothetical protein